MIVPARMLRVRMVVFHEAYQKLLEDIRGKGIFHFSDFSDSPERWKFTGIPNHEEYGDLKDLYGRMQELASELESESRPGIVEGLFPKPAIIKISPKSVDEIREEFNGLQDMISKLEEKRGSLEKMRQSLLSHRQALDLLEEFSKSIEKEKLPRKIGAFFGELWADELPLLLLGLEENGLGNHVYYKKIRKDDEKRAVVLILADEKERPKLDKILLRHEFSSIALPEDGDGVLAVLSKVRNAMSKLEKEEEAVSRELEKDAGEYIGRVHSYMAKVKYEIDMINVRNLLGRSEQTILVEGWIKEKDKERFEKIVHDSSGGRAAAFYFKPDKKKGDIPVALENPGFIRPFEMLTRIFSPPNYSEIDPTPFLAFAFVLFFGIMFADMLDALLLFGITALFYKRFQDSKDAKDLGEILMVCCASAMVFGVIGGEFGGFQLWAKHEILQPTNLLLFALFLGLAQITLGFVIGMVNAIRARDTQELVGGKIGWLLVMAGALAGFFVTWEYAGISVLGIVLILAFKGMREVLDLTRLLSNLLSYVRLLALNMAHVGLSATFAGILGSFFTLGLAGQISAGVMILASHVFLVFVSLFAVFAHALRLQYVEFFSKFYEGGGTIFNPF
jgi:V/A-type H+-transporting ATPase subunit I